MKILLQVQINIVFSILLIILCVHAYFNMNRKKITNKLFMWIMALTWFATTLEIFSIFLDNPNLKQFMIAHKLVNIIGFVVTPIIPFLGYMFNREWINRYQKEKIKANHILLLPLLINGIGTILSYNKFGLFYITSENIYKRGFLFFILPCVSYIYFVYNLYFIYKQHKKLTNPELALFSLFYIVPAIFTYIQLKFYIYLTTWNSTSIIIVITYIFILNDQAHRDSLTGLGNRLCYEQYVQNIDDKKLNKLFMVYIDIDNFKVVNDKYGHNEGDEAIKTFADLLVEGFFTRKKKIIRLGGDEFLIILQQKHSENVEACIQNLSKHLKDYNSSGEKPYKLSFSYGIACYTNASESINEVLKRADKLMYEQKQSKKSKLEI